MEYTYNGKRLDELDKTELLNAMFECCGRLYKNTREPKYLRMAAFAKGCALGLEDGADDDESIALGLAGVEVIEEELAKEAETP